MDYFERPELLDDIKDDVRRFVDSEWNDSMSIFKKIKLVLAQYRGHKYNAANKMTKQESTIILKTKRIDYVLSHMQGIEDVSTMKDMAD